jgi:hypothetical protein
MQLAHTILIATMVNVYIALPAVTEASVIPPAIKIMGKSRCCAIRLT